MKIIVNIEEEIYKSCMPYKDTPIISNCANNNSEIVHAIANGTPIGRYNAANYEQNLKAILDSSLTEVKDEIKESIIDSILRLKAPKRELYAEWINPAYNWLQCSGCGYTTSAKSRFCPNCGAKMGKGEKE